MMRLRHARTAAHFTQSAICDIIFNLIHQTTVYSLMPPPQHILPGDRASSLNYYPQEYGRLDFHCLERNFRNNPQPKNISTSILKNKNINVGSVLR